MNSLLIPIPPRLPTEEELQESRFTLEHSRLRAVEAAELLREKITRRALDDTAPLKTQIEAYTINRDIIVQASKSQEQTKNNGFKIVFELNGVSTDKNIKSITIEQEPDPLSNPPAYVLAVPKTNSELGVADE